VLCCRFNALYYPTVLFFPKLGDGVELFDNRTGDYTHHVRLADC
jgi:hypothetical protein